MLAMAAVLLLVIGLLVLMSGLVEAQEPDTEDLVKNTDESTRDILVLNNVGSGYATSFTTGDNGGGYTLKEVSIRMGGFSSSDGVAVRVRADSSGRPGATEYTLINPDPLPSSAGIATVFSAPDDTVLLANTTYWVTVDREAGSFIVSRTNSDSQSGLSGWSIGDTSRNRGAGWNTSTTRSSHLILSVRGYTNSTDATAPVLVDAIVFSSGDLIALDYNEAIDGTATGAPNREDFSLNVDGSAAEIVSVSVPENSPTRVLLIPRLRIYRGQTVSLSYSDPTTGDDARATQDLAGNDAESFDARVVTNSSSRSLISLLLTASPEGPNSIWLEWDLPRGVDGDGITGYHIEYSDDGGLNWDNVVDYTGDRTWLRSTVHRGLAPATVYSYRISTITGGRSNLPSSIVSAETDVQPPVIDGLSYSTGTGNVSGQNHAVADMCWTPDGVSVSDLDEFQFGLMYAELDENSAMPWEDDGTFTFNDVRLSECDGGAGMGVRKKTFYRD